MKKMTIGNILGRSRITIGEGLPTRINFIVGVNSTESEAVNLEIKKIDLAVKLGVDTITDLSMVRLERPLWSYVKERYPHIGVGINPPYLPYVEGQTEITPKALMKEIERFVSNGGDYMTMNFLPRTRQELEEFSKERKIPITSRQGGLIAVSMRKHGTENPYNDIFNDVIFLLKRYNATVNIGSTFRPAGVVEANDRAHLWEVEHQMEIHRILDGKGIPSLVEVMSHQLLHQVGEKIIELRKQHGGYVPFQLLGPVVTDIGNGYDYIASAIGAAEAARYNVGKVTVIPAKEHIGFPSLEDSEIGIIATKIAVHAGDLMRIPELIEEDAAILSKRSEYLSCNSELRQSGCDKCGHFCPIVLGQS